MPGLIGIVWNNRVDERLLDKMSNSIKHEKWHQLDKYTGPFFSAARVDLGIFNPEPQPIFNEDRTLCIFIYGKIYDYEREASELKYRGHKFTVGNDAEYCLHSYEEYGKSFVKSLNGSFVLAIYDLKQRKVIVTNDRYGFRPLYYTISGGKLLFASEVKAILEDKAFNKELNDETIADFFAFGEILGNKTFFKGIETLPPASVLTYDGRNISIEQYWDFSYEPDYSLSEHEIADRLVATFKRAIDIRMKDNLRLGVSLSGGLDSRVVLAAIDKSERHRVTAFTFGVPGCDEIKVAQMVAKKAGINHSVIELDADELVSYAEKVVCLSDGMDTIAVGFIPFAYGKVKSYVDVAFSGSILDTSVANPWLTNEIVNAKSDEELSNILLKKWRFFSDEELSRLFINEYYAKIKTCPLSSFKEAFDIVKESHPANKSDHFELRNHARRFMIMGHVVSRNIVEDSNPGLDNEFINVVVTIPPELRLHYRVYRRFLKRLSPELAAIPYQRMMVRADAPLVAWRIGEIYQYSKERLKREIWRLTGGRVYLPNKRGYVNLDEWLRLNEKWRGLVRGLLLDNKASSRKYFNREFIETLLEEHQSGSVDHSQRLVYLATFELFLRMFVDKPSSANRE